jgi:hypothetical protein
MNVTVTLARSAPSMLAMEPKIEPSASYSHLVSSFSPLLGAGLTIRWISA